MRPTLVRCPQCGNTVEYRTDNPSRPFCSPRCRLIDLGAWAEERYTIAGPSELAEQSGVEESPENRSAPATAKPRLADS